VDTPVYVLASSTTWSGAQQFSYDLKRLKRATLIGETTRGGVHAGAFIVSTTTSAWTFAQRRRSTLLQRPTGEK
jgi:C-terminal processing protease CtpA/Prc